MAKTILPFHIRSGRALLNLSQKLIETFLVKFVGKQGYEVLYPLIPTSCRVEGDPQGVNFLAGTPELLSGVRP